MKLSIYYLLTILLVFFCSCSTLSKRVKSESQKENIQKAKNDLVVDLLHGKVLSVREIQYNLGDKSGQIPTDTTGRILTNRITFYNQEGNTSEVSNFIHLGPGKNVFSKRVFKYDDRGYKTESHVFNADGSPSGFKTTYVYNDKGDLMEERQFREDDSLVQRKTYMYDTKQNRISSVDKRTRIMYSYDAQGGLIEDNEYSVAFDRRIRAHKYDGNGFLMLSIYYEAKGQVTSYKYEKDEQGNWIKLLGYDKNGDLSILSGREIEYYP